jgi:acetyltransferase-like isoleucine patch superfamily enzyme
MQEESRQREPFGFQGALQFCKHVMRELLWAPPAKLERGDRSYIYRPRRIDGTKFIKIGSRTTVDQHGWLSAVEHYAGRTYSPQIMLGNDVHVGRYCCITCISSIVLEDGCLLSEGVYISDLAHGLDPTAGLIIDQPLVSKGPVRIGANTFIGYRACILPGVTLGEGCVVGANSVVTRSFESYSMVGGCPARLVKRYSPTQRRWVSCSEDSKS